MQQHARTMRRSHNRSPHVSPRAPGETETGLGDGALEAEAEAFTSAEEEEEEEEARCVWNFLSVETS